MVVENPFPGDPVAGVRIVKTAEDTGDILLTAFETVDQGPEFDQATVSMPQHY